MKANRLILFLVLTAALFSCNEQEQKPNIVVFLCDDLGYGDLGAYGHAIIETPNLDAMAAKGMRFTDFYSAAPVCSPSRVGLLTGRSPNRAGVYDFIPGYRKQEDLRHMVHLQEYEITIPALLKSAGYATCLSGKWHCNSRFNNEAQPQPNDFGFEHWFATHNNSAPSHENPKNFVRNGKVVGEIQGYSSQIVVDEAISWLDQKQDDRPFYLQVTFHEPHEPIASPKELVDKYLPKSDTLPEAMYYANVENVDIAVGRMMTYLEENGHDNTLIIFTSDNGPETLNRYQRAWRSYGTPGDLKGMKLWTTEAGFRVPGIMYWKGKTESTTSDAVVSSLDFLPTFCELAGVELPDVTLDGESVTSLFNNRTFNRTKPLTWGFYNALNEHQVAMRDGDWKILARLRNDTTYVPMINNLYHGNEALVKESDLVDYELYNLKDDRGEANELSESNREEFMRMKRLLQQEYASLLEGSHIWSE
ncbi:MAG: sulfatase-like hydrolase/transferase [Cyclobacteriaceae bacterium]